MRREMRDKSESGISDKKIFSYYQYDSFRDEKIIGIVMSSNLKEAEKTVKDHYRNAYRGDFTIKLERMLSNSIAEMNLTK